MITRTSSLSLFPKQNFVNLVSRFRSNSKKSLSTSSVTSTVSTSLPPFQPILISIEGNIGAGKSTLLSKLRENNWTFIDEPVDTWSGLVDEENKNILELFYQDKNRWSYSFQNCALLTRFHNIETTIDSIRDLYYNNHEEYKKKFLTPTSTSSSSKAYHPHIFVTERSLDTDYYVFTLMLFKEKFLNSLELKLYRMLSKKLKNSSKGYTPLSGIIFMEINPNICHERIKLRDRKGEQDISIDYLKQLDEAQANWIKKIEENNKQYENLGKDLISFEKKNTRKDLEVNIFEDSNEIENYISMHRTSMDKEKDVEKVVQFIKKFEQSN